MQIGDWKVCTLLEGTFALDGGAMFGIVPQPLWSREHPPDDRGRITMALRLMLLDNGQRKILVDCGIGNRFDDRQQSIYQYRSSSGGIQGVLGSLGIDGNEITDVIVTHLHFDHVAGMLRRDARSCLVPTFPNAQVFLQRAAWDWANDPSAWDAASFFHRDFEIWDRELSMCFLSGDVQIAPGVRVQATDGHTPGHQIVSVASQGVGAVYCADLIPTAAHIKLPYIMAYDQQPLATLDEKKVLLAQALEEKWLLVFEHDPKVVACRLTEKEDAVIAGEQILVDLI